MKRPASPSVAVVVLAVLAGGLAACPREGPPAPPIDPPTDFSVTASAPASAAPSTKTPPELVGKRTCRDGFLFDLSGAPTDVGGFGTMTPLSNEPAPPRVALNGTMGTVTEGALPSDALEAETCKMVGRLGSCFQFELKTKPKLRGDLSLEVDVALNGKVMQTRRTGGIAISDTLMGCISNAFLAARYPMPKAKTTFTYGIQVKTHAHLSIRSVSIVDTGVSFAGPGTLPVEVVKRIVRATFPRFRACYELGVDRDPKLKGQVTGRLLVDSTGAVSAVKDGPTTIPDPIVASCVMGVFQTMAFPEPVGGDVEITMPLALANVP